MPLGKRFGGARAGCGGAERASHWRCQESGEPNMRDSHAPLAGRCPPPVTVNGTEQGRPGLWHRAGSCHCRGFYANATCQAVNAQGSWTWQGSSWVPWVLLPLSLSQVLKDGQQELRANSPEKLEGRRGDTGGSQGGCKGERGPFGLPRASLEEGPSSSKILPILK